MTPVIVGLVLLAFIVWDAIDAARARRERENMRHITGARPWWGQR